MQHLSFIRLVLLPLFLNIFLSSCATPNPATSDQETTRRLDMPPLAQKLVLSTWAGYMPQSILDAFEKEYGVEVDYQIYGTQEDALANLRAGKVYDVLVLSSTLIPGALQDGLLAELNYANIPNFKYVSPNFRDLSYDPANLHSIMYQWGTAGLLVRTDLVDIPIQQWRDLWEPHNAGKIALWPYQRDVISMALLSLGYSINTTEVKELAEAKEQLLALSDKISFIEPTIPTAAALIAKGEKPIAHGWSYDFLEARKSLKSVEYVLPKEGAFLWGDNVTIPMNSPNPYTAETFINFLFRPEISAMITNEIYVATPNDAAKPFIDPALVENSAIFPTEAELAHCELILPLDAATQKIHDEMWQEFLQKIE